MNTNPADPASDLPSAAVLDAALAALSDAAFIRDADGMVVRVTGVRSAGEPGRGALSSAHTIR